MINKKKFGLIKISNDIFINQPDLVREIYKTFYPISIECKPLENHVWFLFGYCHDFQEINDGDEPLSYDVNFTEKKDKTFDLKYTHNL